MVTREQVTINKNYEIDDGQEKIEIRSADTCANPYIAFALLI